MSNVLPPELVAVRRSAGQRRAPEKRLQTQISRALHTLGFFVTSTSQPQRAMNTAGIPDLFAAHRRFGQLWIEVKAPHRKTHKNGGLSTDQLAWHKLARECGVNVVTAYSVADVVEALKALGAPLV